MMLRLKGTVADCMAATQALTTVLEVCAISDFHADRVAESYGRPGFGRVYIDADPIDEADYPIRATASRTDVPPGRWWRPALPGGRREIEQKGDRS